MQVTRSYDAELAAKLDLAGGEMSGNIVLANNVGLQSKRTGGGVDTLLSTLVSDVVQVGPSGLPLKLRGNSHSIDTDDVQQKPFISTDQTITAAAQLTLAHGLGAAPSFALALLVCTVADQNYAIGDVVPINPHMSPGVTGTHRGQAIWWDATNIFARYGSTAPVYRVLNKGTGSEADIVITSWKLRLVAFP